MSSHLHLMPCFWMIGWYVSILYALFYWTYRRFHISHIAVGISPECNWTFLVFCSCRAHYAVSIWCGFWWFNCIEWQLPAPMWPDIQKCFSLFKLSRLCQISIRIMSAIISDPSILRYWAQLVMIGTEVRYTWAKQISATVLILIASNNIIIQL